MYCKYMPIYKAQCNNLIGSKQGSYGGVGSVNVLEFFVEKRIEKVFLLLN